jgi:PleD family two-component response regulator
MGSTFSFTIPFEEVQEDKTEVSNIDFNKFKDLRVLIVDDSSNSRDILYKYLKYWTIECVTADSGKEALSVLKSVL